MFKTYKLEENADRPTFKTIKGGFLFSLFPLVDKRACSGREWDLRVGLSTSGLY